MRALLLFALLGLALADFPAPVVQINLDLPPEQRWKAVTEDVLTRHGWDYSFGEVMGSVYNILPQPLVDLVDPIFEEIGNSLGDYGLEIRGVFDIMAAHGYDKSANMTFGKLVMINFVYELTSFCTSTVAQNVNGTIFHGRNLDYDYNGLTNITYTAEFVSNGQLQYFGTVFVGYVGLLTGMRPGAFSVSVDERGLEDPITDIILNLASALEGGQSVGFFLRDQLAAPYQGFNSLLNTLNNTRLIAPVYLITAGVNSGEGAVITRNRTHADDSDGVNNGVWRLSPPSAWYRLETNYDHWKPVPNDDNRRDPGNEMMTALGPANINVPSLFKVMSTAPVNNDQTCYTTIMSPSLGLYYTTVRIH